MLPVTILLITYFYGVLIGIVSYRWLTTLKRSGPYFDVNLMLYGQLF